LNDNSGGANVFLFARILNSGLSGKILNHIIESNAEVKPRREGEYKFEGIYSCWLMMIDRHACD